MPILEEAALRTGAGWEAQGHCPGRAGSVGLQQGEFSELHGAGEGLEAEWVLPGFGRKREETTHFPSGRERAGWLPGGAAETGGVRGTAEPCVGLQAPGKSLEEAGETRRRVCRGRVPDCTGRVRGEAAPTQLCQ